MPEKTTNELVLTEEVQTLLPLVDKFAQLFPNEANTEEDRRLIMNFALALNGVKTKSGAPAVKVCTKESIVQCGLDILNKKLDLSKNQVYLIAYGDKLQLQDSYFGRVALVKKELGINIRGSIIHEGDIIEITVDESGLKHISQKTKWENLSHKITGAYATAIDAEGKLIDSDIMTFQEIYNSWLQSTRGVSEVHKKFTNEMTRKTIESRLAKHIYQKYSDSAVFYNDEDIEIDEPTKKDDYVNVIDNANADSSTIITNNDFEQLKDIEVQEADIYEEPTVVEEQKAFEEPKVDNTQNNQFEEFEQPKPQVQEQQAQPKDINTAVKGDILEIKYGDAKNLVAGQGWRMIAGTYNALSKTVKVEKL